ncbi:hypothetical protein MNBD_ALPHA06-216 [hydrothermal vent metagenome]|uniref:Uncharacterized protein n=1 Tax=hydrothermal vent metagenome TaxID=652676 RepID=A0A3B0RSU2_9ZZZZ
MSIAKIIWAVSFLAAIVFSFVTFGMSGVVLAVLGLIAGWFVDSEHRRGLIIAAIFLMMAGGAGAWGDIPVVGTYLTAIFGSYAAVLAAASLTAILKTTLERLKP